MVGADVVAVNNETNRILYRCRNHRFPFFFLFFLFSMPQQVKLNHASYCSSLVTPLELVVPSCLVPTSPLTTVESTIPTSQSTSTHVHTDVHQAGIRHAKYYCFRTLFTIYLEPFAPHSLFSIFILLLFLAVQYWLLYHFASSSTPSCSS
jgi:hypothetical protein